MIDLDSLRCFAAVAATAHFGVAARTVGLSPAAFSERVRRLEEDLGCVLLHRTSRRVHLTDEGQRLLSHAHALLADAARCADVARGATTPAPYELTIGTRYELGLSWLAPLIQPLADARPERTLHLAMGDTDALLDGLERGRIDAAVLSARITRPHLRYAALHQETYTFVGASPFSLADAPRATLCDVSPDTPLFRYLADALPDGRILRFGRYQYLGGIGAIRHLVLDGAGVAVLPRYFIADDLAAGRLRDLLPDVPLASDWFRLVWRAGHVHEPRLEALAEALRAAPLR